MSKIYDVWFHPRSWPHQVVVRTSAKSPKKAIKKVLKKYPGKSRKDILSVTDY